ncbi:hypothetical protein [Dactylosporangium sp. CS-033363]|uniref:hypothetical protein n=1 Tax=Dactylosporangium sp. CS-033363 TaxID=3239935 RepID=UPI003D8AFB4F
MTPEPGWAPLVYCRLWHADSWWRAVPSGRAPARYGPLVAAALGTRPHRRDAAPRFVQAVVDGERVVAAALRVAEVSEDLGHDAGGRPLFAVVGWVSAGPSAPPPELDLLAEQMHEWAGEQLDRWVRDVWTDVGPDVQQPRPSSFDPPPWAEATAEPGPALRIRPGTVRVVPRADRLDLWSAAAGTVAQFTAVVGVDTVDEIDPIVTSHACLEIAIEPFDLPVPPPPVPVPAAFVPPPEPSPPWWKNPRKWVAEHWPCHRPAPVAPAPEQHSDNRLDPELFRARKPGDGSLI